ncbi:hypothetical protein Clacol_005318 [Clathrus columnatus]|uniref:Sulfotransferase family protein n=1 Tax=Clathrus columnatus TaxID=1419009 RepID=A0AAV5A8Y2_9AGAM|nr:hypothetical protein Clacol_005318 [Clathrus columnatus]
MSSKPKVICLALGRTGTVSLMEALDTLGFGPCYHMKVVFENHDPEEVKTWINTGQAAIYFKELYQAYPDAKFILTTRDPAKWEASVKNTLLPAMDVFQNTRTPDPDSFPNRICDWFNIEMLARYHQGKLHTDAQNEIIAHNQRVMQTIPADKLLVYEVSQGWDPLVNFLGVEKPDIPFPHSNDTASFQKEVQGIIKTMENHSSETTS